MAAIEVGTVYHWCGTYLYRVETVDHGHKKVTIRRIGSAMGKDLNFTIAISSGTEKQSFNFEMFDENHTKVYACHRHGMMYFK